MLTKLWLWFNLSFNELTGIIPTELGNLTELNKMNLLGTYLVRSIPTELRLLRELLGLDMWGNALAELGVLSDVVGDLNTIFCTGDSSYMLVPNVKFPKLNLLGADCDSRDPNVICDFCTRCVGPK